MGVEREPDLGPDPLQHVAGALNHQRVPVPLHQEVGRLRLGPVPVDIADDLPAQALGGRHAAELGPLPPLDLEEHALAIVLDVFQLEVDELANRTPVPRRMRTASCGQPAGAALKIALTWSSV